MSIGLASSDVVHYPAAPPAIALLVGVGLGVRWPALSAAVLVSLVGLTWLCAVAACLCSRGNWTTRYALVGYLSVGMLLGAQAATDSEATGLWRWYQHQSPRIFQRPVLVEGRLMRDRVPTAYGARLDLKIDRVQSASGWTAVEGGVSVTVGGTLAAVHGDAWMKGRRLRMPVTLRPAAQYSNPGVPNQRRVLMRRGTSLLGSVKSALLVEVIDAGHRWSESSAVIRAQVRRRVTQTVGHFSPRSSAVVTAVLIGDRAGLGPEARRRLQEGGTYHVIAISGGNIAILSAALLLVLRCLGCSRRAASVVTIGCLLAYGSIVGSEASIARATFEASVFLSAMAMDHRASPINTLALSAACLAGVAPLLVVDAGFLLTFGATLGILVGVEPLVDWVRGLAERTGQLGGRVVRLLATMLFATICAELALLPIAATAFSRVTFAGLVLNFVAIPLMTIAQVAGLLAAGVSLGSERAGLAVAYGAHLAALGIVESARLVDVLPWLSWRVASPGLLLIVGYYLGWWILLQRGARRVVRQGGVGLVVTTAALILGGPIGLPKVAPACRGMADPLEVMFLDVDQADATLVRFPSGRALLVDAGGTVHGTFDVGARIVSPVLWGAGIRRLDYLALTHGDPDHVGGAASVIQDFRPREVWTGVPVPGAEPLQEIARMSHRVGAVWRVLQRGDRLVHAGVSVRLWQPPVPEWERRNVRNDDSLVIELRYGRVSVVLPGDIGRTVESALSPDIPPAPLRVLKVPHHGSQTSSSAEFITALRPRVAVVSAGRPNRFGHPAPDVVRRYQEAGAMLLHTGDGAVSLCTDGSSLVITAPALAGGV